MTKDGKVFRSASHLFFYTKAVLNGCPDTANQILKSERDVTLYSIARCIKTQDNWYGIRDDVMNDVIQYKIGIWKERLVVELNETRGRKIIHATNHNKDCYWTCGLTERMALITSPKEFPGENILGKMWTRLANDDEFMNA